MNAVSILVALICGFVGGVLGSIVTIEAKIAFLRKDINECRTNISEIKLINRKTDSSINGLAIAIQRVIEQHKRDRAGIWESLNGLWSDYDRRQKQEEQPEIAEEPQPEVQPKEEPAKEPEESKPGKPEEREKNEKRKGKTRVH